jgi:hypothetical protein
MSEHNFTLVITGPVVEKLDDLYEAGCDDALFGEIDGVQYGEFDREAPGLRQAITSAVRAVESVESLRVDRVEPEDLVTISEIAVRSGRSRESVRLLVAGERGPGDFPAPVSHLRERNRLWRWSDVAEWFGQTESEQVHDALFVAALNAALELRRRQSQLEDQERELVAELVS